MGGDFVSIQSLRGEISYQSRGDSVSGETLFRDTGVTWSRDPRFITECAAMLSTVSGGAKVDAGRLARLELQ